MRLAAALLLVANVAFASGSIGGRVTSGGKPLARVTVTASTPSMPQPFSTSSSGSGAYLLPSLPAGTYDVTFSLAGHQTLTRRAEVRSFERARIDADLEVSEEGESVTQTSTERDVHERPQAAWTLDAATAELLPIGRLVTAYTDLAPAGFIRARVDGIRSFFDYALPPEAILQTSVVFAGAAAETDERSIDVTTRGSDAFQAALRDRITRRAGGDTTQLQEASVAGRWLFAAALRSDAFRSGFAKGSFTPTRHDTATVSFLGTNLPGRDEPRGTWLRVSPSFTAQVEGMRGFAALRAYALAGGAHEVAAGIEEQAFYVRDRWNVSDRGVVEGGLRVQDGELLPRLGLVYGEETRFIASYARYAFEGDEGAIGVARRVLSNGYARAMFIRREHRNIGTLDGSLRWLLFTFGTTATFATGETSANAWAIVEPPLPGQKLSVSLLERYRGGTSTTDIGVNYAYPFERLTPFVELETVNVFDRNDGRVFRLGFGIKWQ